jgi:hypothetical protein
MAGKVFNYFSNIASHGCSGRYLKAAICFTQISRRKYLAQRRDPAYLKPCRYFKPSRLMTSGPFQAPRQFRPPWRSNAAKSSAVSMAHNLASKVLKLGFFL